MRFAGLTLVRVIGASMAPTVTHGSYALFHRRKTYKEGDVVLAQHPDLGPIVKRIASQLPGGGYLLSGDHPASTPTSAMGLVSEKAIGGKMIWLAAAKRSKHLSTA